MIVKVLVELSNKNIDKTFDYVVPNDLKDKVQVGKRVIVPFAHQTLEGFVLEISDHSDEKLDLKEIIDIVDNDIVLNKELLELGKYMQSITLATLISCYQAMLPKALKAKNSVNINKKMDTYLTLGNIDNQKFNPKQLEIIELVKKNNKVLFLSLNI